VINGGKNMVNDNIKKYRLKNNLTQQQLADKLYVTAQAVSRWEKGEVEPSIAAITELAKIFNITTDQLLNDDLTNEEEKKSVEQPQVTTEAIKPQLGVCEVCKKVIYDKNDYFLDTIRVGTGRTASHRSRVICFNCYKKIETQKEIEKKQKQLKIVKKSKSRVKWSFIIGGIILALIIAIVSYGSSHNNPNLYWAILFGTVLFTFISCLMFENNFVGDLFFSIFKWSYVKFPGIIFSLDFDGIKFLIFAKLLFFALGIIISIVVSLLAFIVSSVFSLFVYPYALYTVINHPEKSLFDI
jgi:transcriptional regulator with XRE-family HTH domain